MLLKGLFSVGLVIIGGLAAYAIYLQRKVRAKIAEQKSQEEALVKENVDQRRRINQSIQIIAQGALEDQLSLTEASIRIKVLLDSLGLEKHIIKQYDAFYVLALATDHIPILAQWKALSNKQQRVFEKQRVSLEAEHKEAVVEAAGRIKGQTF